MKSENYKVAESFAQKLLNYLDEISDDNDPIISEMSAVIRDQIKMVRDHFERNPNDQ